MTRYQTLETAALAVLKDIPSFSGHPDWITLSDYRILDHGIDMAIVLDPGEIGEDEADQMTDWREFSIIVNLFIRKLDVDADTAIEFRRVRDELLEAFEENPTMGTTDGSVLESGSRSDGPPAWIVDRTAPTVPVWYGQTFIWFASRQISLSGGNF